MIHRIWHGWTTRGNADAYEGLLGAEIFTGIAARNLPGYRGIELLRREVGAEVEFVTIMRFETLDAVRAFAGAEYETAVVPPAAPGSALTIRRALGPFRASRDVLHAQRVNAETSPISGANERRDGPAAGRAPRRGRRDADRPVSRRRSCALACPGTGR